MQRNFITTVESSTIKIAFTKKKMTAYGGFALLASFFKKIGFAGMIEDALPIEERSPNGKGIYGKMIAFTAMIFAGAVLTPCVSMQQGCPREHVRGKEACLMPPRPLHGCSISSPLLKQRIPFPPMCGHIFPGSSPGTASKKTGSLLTRPCLSVMASGKEQRKATIPPNMAGQAIIPYVPFSTGASRLSTCGIDRVMWPPGTISSPSSVMHMVASKTVLR
jgi:hypothetical protein